MVEPDHTTTCEPVDRPFYQEYLKSRVQTGQKLTTALEKHCARGSVPSRLNRRSARPQSRTTTSGSRNGIMEAEKVPGLNVVAYIAHGVYVGNRRHYLHTRQL
jgi:hypothetical protein